MSDHLTDKGSLITSDLLSDNEQLQVQHVYRAMDLLEKHIDLIQKRLFQYTTVVLKERNVSRVYYDCTNFYSEKELEDSDVSDKSEEWHSEHTLRKYGASKEHRPNPIVQMGLFMDGDGMPLGFCINPGNTSEQVTMKPLENELIKVTVNFSAHCKVKNHFLEFYQAQ